MAAPPAAAAATTKSFAVDFVRSRWMTMVASFFIMACNGTTYAFGIYSQTMKLTLGYNQEQITTIGFYKDLGGNLGIVAGILQDFGGAWVVIFSGTILNIVGSLMIWLGVTQRIAPPSVWQMSLYHFICFNATAFVNTAIIVTGIQNFPGNRGFVLGLVKGFFGLSGALLGQIYLAIYGSNPSSFLLMIMWLPTIVFLVFMFFIRRQQPRRDGNEVRRFLFLMGTSVLLAIFLLVVIVVRKLKTVTRTENQVLAAIAVVILTFPLALVYRSVQEDRQSTSSQNDDSRSKDVELELGDSEAKTPPKDAHDPEKDQKEKKSSVEPASDLPEAASPPASGSIHQNHGLRSMARGLFGGLGERVRRGENHTVIQALLSIDFWLLFIISTCALGTGLMAIDNIGQVSAALRSSSLSTGTFVSLISIWNFAGRVSSGFVSEFCLSRYRIPRPVFFALPLGMACIGHLLFAFAVPGALDYGSILIGFCYGFQAPILFIIISELFGLAFFGTLYNLATMSLPLGTELMSVLVAGRLYDREAGKQHRMAQQKLTPNLLLPPSPTIHPPRSNASKALVCIGKQCYRNSFLIMAGVSAFGCILGIILTLRTYHFYRKNAARLTDTSETELQEFHH